MSKNKNIDIICIVVAVAMIAGTVLFIGGESFGLSAAQRTPEYVKLFDTSKVHTIDIQIGADEWQNMLDNAQKEEYVLATVVIDGEKIQGVGLRPKGNSSLSMIASADSDRYSFKVEFDHYSNSISYHGLDKLALNNIAQDNTYMKDYVSYQMMNAMGANAPLSSFIFVTLNGEDWGLYLAAEGIEESFAQRVYGKNYGEIYKPESTGMQLGNRDNQEPGERPGFGQNGGGFGGGMGGMSSGATTLKYIDDDPDSYSAIFDNAVFKKISDTDKANLIASLKQLSSGENINEIVDTDEVMRYFAVHNFVLNSDSYTGNLIHNYYLSERGGKLSMIAWDYNLAFGGMGGGDANSLVNYSVSEPLLSGNMSDRPMLAWIFENEEYLTQYYAICAEFTEYFSDGKFAEMFDGAIDLISPYVEKDPTAFCTYDDFLKGSATLREFCLLRAESVSNQLAENGVTVDASGIDMSSMGSNNNGFGKARGDRGDENFPDFGGMPDNFPSDLPSGFSGGFPGGMPGERPGRQGNSG